MLHHASLLKSSIKQVVYFGAINCCKQGIDVPDFSFNIAAVFEKEYHDPDTSHVYDKELEPLYIILL
jgi:hypothetical protein